MLPESLIFFWIAASLANAVFVNHIGIKMLLASDLSTCSLMVILPFVMDQGI